MLRLSQLWISPCEDPDHRTSHDAPPPPATSPERFPLPPWKPVCKCPSTKVPPFKTPPCFCPPRYYFLDTPLALQLENFLPFFASLLTCHQLRAFRPRSLHPPAEYRHPSFVRLQPQTAMTAQRPHHPPLHPCRSPEGVHGPLPHTCGLSAQWAQRRSPANTVSIPCFLLP